MFIGLSVLDGDIGKIAMRKIFYSRLSISFDQADQVEFLHYCENNKKIDLRYSQYLENKGVRIACFDILSTHLGDELFTMDVEVTVEMKEDVSISDVIDEMICDMDGLQFDNFELIPPK